MASEREAVKAAIKELTDLPGFLEVYGDEIQVDILRLQVMVEALTPRDAATAIALCLLGGLAGKLLGWPEGLASLCARMGAQDNVWNNLADMGMLPVPVPGAKKGQVH